MKIENEFVVKAPVDHVWDYLLDVERVAPCMPGAQLTEVVDDRTWKGKTNVKIGPVSLSFSGICIMEERDDDARRVVLKAEGREQRGKGAATARVVSRMEPVEDGTRVHIETDLTITGAVAQYGRGMIQDISQRMTNEFAKCLQANIGAAEAAPAERGLGEVMAEPATSSNVPAAPPRPGPGQVAPPVRGLRLGMWALWRAVVRFFRRLLGRPEGESDRSGS
jgi:carbon monoxide dehydrogenase subunit G